MATAPLDPWRKPPSIGHQAMQYAIQGARCTLLPYHRVAVADIAPAVFESEAARIVANTIAAAREAGDHGFGEGPEGQRRFDLWLSVLTRDWPTTLRCLNAGRGA